jgi:hypothetical protein
METPPSLRYPKPATNKFRLVEAHADPLRGLPPGSLGSGARKRAHREAA